MRKLDIKAYAKINLALDVVGKRPDGYHNIRTVMQHIDLHDNLCVKWTEGTGDGIKVETASNKRYLPSDDRNVAYKAAKLMIDRFDIEKKLGPGLVRIDIKKQIPVAAGLGGGSADGAAVICALSEIWELSLPLEQLCGLGAKIGADVPFCVMGQVGIRSALAEGIGTKLTPTVGLKSWVVLTRPKLSVSTAKVYEGFDLLDGEFKRPDIDGLIAAIERHDFAAAKVNMINVLENYTLSEYPIVAETKKKMTGETSPAIALMSGSGPTIVGFYAKRASAMAAYEKMAQINVETLIAKTLYSNGSEADFV